jgi:hypothetical protein
MRSSFACFAVFWLVGCSEPTSARLYDAGDGAVHADAHVPGDAGATSDAGAMSDAGSNPGLASLVSLATFEQMFPQRNALYSYSAFLAAAAYYPTFASEGSADSRKREVAAFLANIAHETTGGWDTAPGGRFAWGLYFTQEVGCESGACTGYCDGSNATYPCAPGKTYHGRGPIQLSWNYNYGQVGAVVGLDLLNDPDLVTSNGTVAFRTAFWFWMTAQAPKPSCHAVMVGTYVPAAADVTAGRLPGMGLTIDVINGGIECGWARSASVTDRLGFYDRFTTMLSVSPGSNLDCDTMQPY